ISAQSEAPRMMRRARNPDTRIGHHLEMFGGALLEPMARVAAQIDFMMTSSNVECLGKFAGAGTEFSNIIHAAALLHERDSAPWLERANQDKTILSAFHEHIQHPVHAIVEIDVCRARFV